MSQFRDLLASSPSAFLNQSNFPAQQGFPAPGAAVGSITAQNTTARKSPDLPNAEAGRQSALQEVNANVCLWNFSVRFTQTVCAQGFWKIT